MPLNLFRPVHDAHAIVEQVIFFEFTPTLEQAMPALITLKDDLLADFPLNEIMNTMRVQFSQQAGGKPEIGSPEIKEAGGIRLFRLQDNGAPDTIINIDLNGIGINCYNYSKWPDIWTQQKSFIKKIFSKLSASPSFMTGIGMKWTDQFLYEGIDANYDVQELLKKSSDCLHPRTFASGTRWHCHTGWFDASVSAGHEVLNQLNLDAGLVNLNDAMRTAVTIDHTQLVRVSHSVDELAAFSPRSSAGLDALSGLIEALHDGNKRILRDLLTEAALDRIGLGAGTAR